MRSLLFVPGDSERKLAKGLESGADVLLIDLEDSVALTNKVEARRITSEFLQQNRDRRAPPLLYVRINSFDSGLLEDDLAAVMQAVPHGILLPKAEHGKDVTHLDARLLVYEAQNNIAQGATRIAAIITESAKGTLNAGTYQDRSQRLTAVTWGAEDLSADIGALEKRDAQGVYRDVFRHARTVTLLGAVNAGVAPIDTVYTDFRNMAGLRDECEEAAIDGFTGKMAIHPAQVPIINEVFTPSKEAIARAQAIVDTFEQAGNPGVIGLDGEMLDRPHLIRAQALLARVEQ
jgi:citrate lyase subunit beta/citryl-CoA lyase